MFSMHNMFDKTTKSYGEISGEVGELLPQRHIAQDQGDHHALEKAFARLFSSDDGQLVLSHLQSITFQRALGPEAPDAQLRYLEGQRAMIATIMRLIRAGRL